MASSPIVPLYNGQLSNSSAALYTSPTGVWTQLTKVLAVNTDTSAHTVTFHIVPNGGSSATANISTNAQAVLAGQAWNDPNEYGLVLAPGDAIYGNADTGSQVNVFIAGFQATS